MHTFIVSQLILKFMYLPCRIGEQQSTGLEKIQFYVKNRFVIKGSEQPFIPLPLMRYSHDYLRNLLERRQADIKRKCLKLWKVCLQYNVDVCCCCFASLCNFLFVYFIPVGQVHFSFCDIFSFVFIVFSFLHDQFDDEIRKARSIPEHKVIFNEVWKVCIASSLDTCSCML